MVSDENPIGKTFTHPIEWQPGALTTEELVAARFRVRRPWPKKLEDTIFGDWVYCSQHLAPHLTGWCTVDNKDKVGLGIVGRGEQARVAAWDKCRWLRLPLTGEKQS